MTEADIKRLTDRAKVVQNYIDQERVRCAGLVAVIDDKNFLRYCISDCVCQPDEIEHWRARYDELGLGKSAAPVADDFEDLM